MEFNLLKDHLKPSEDEKIIKTYHCTSLVSKILRLKAEGFLNITNKRVIFYALGSSFAGQSIFDSELPIEDVSGISSYKGAYFSLKHLFSAIMASGFFSFLFESITIYLIYDLFTKNPDIKLQQAFLWVIASVILFISFFMKKKSLWKSILVATASFIFLSIGGLNIARDISGIIFKGLNNEKFNWGFFIGSLSVLFYCICLFWYACRETISLVIGSRGGSNTPIAISGIAGIGLRDSTALKALSAEPAVDAEKMINEVGAVILDIQTLGDLGIKKWS